jgi:actin-related protein
MRNESPLLLSLPSTYPRVDIERIVQICFEEINVPGLYIAYQPITALYACGFTTGLVVDLGHGRIDVTPVLDSQESGARAWNVGDIEAYLVGLLKEDAVFMREYGAEPDIELAKAIKESDICCTFKTRELVQARTGAGETRAEFTYKGKKVLRGWDL